MGAQSLARVVAAKSHMRRVGYVQNGASEIVPNAGVVRDTERFDKLCGLGIRRAKGHGPIHQSDHNHISPQRIFVQVWTGNAVTKIGEIAFGLRITNASSVPRNLRRNKAKAQPRLLAHTVFENFGQGDGLPGRHRLGLHSHGQHGHRGDKCAAPEPLPKLATGSSLRGCGARGEPAHRLWLEAVNTRAPHGATLSVVSKAAGDVISISSISSECRTSR
mmetsp:Transcript_27766/g.51713  ORF Transcript_27766/g.51713 Transcript_27766/m.51713 type:complete len:219 (+) Transcript_27766:305-961(+)